MICFVKSGFSKPLNAVENDIIQIEETELLELLKIYNPSTELSFTDIDSKGSFRHSALLSGHHTKKGLLLLFAGISRFSYLNSLAMKNKQKLMNRITPDLSIKTLLYLLKTSDMNSTAQALLKRKSEFESLLKSDLDFNTVLEILKLLIYIYNLNNKKVRHQLLAITQSEGFVYNIENCLSNAVNFVELSEVIHYFLYFVDVNITELPHSKVPYDRFQSLLDILYRLLESGKCANKILWTNELNLLLQKKLSCSLNRGTFNLEQLTIHPNPVDILEYKTISPNKINGTYQSVEEYLKVLFMILKEDYEACFREGLMEMKSKLRLMSSNEFENKELFIYHNVRIEGYEVDANPWNGVLHRINFPIAPKGSKSFNINKPFVNGSLLFFSSHSQFTTFVVATVVDDVILQESEKDCMKVLTISVHGDPLQLKPGHVFTMIEPKRFFEPYFQVLKALQSKSTTSFPLEKYILKSNIDPNIPKYLSPDTTFKMNNLNIKLFSKYPWPWDLFKLDDSQLQAFQTALTHEFVLISGPPGTGKTHLIETIIDVLLDNKDVLSTPILFISVRNDIVDLILEKKAGRRRVVRLGGQTKSELLKKHLLTNTVKHHNLRTFKENINCAKESLLEKMHSRCYDIKTEFDYLQKKNESYEKNYGNNVARQLLLEKTEIIGGTTSGCARLHEMLANLKPEVVIVDNANEVMEPHVVASLTEGCKHLILVGDNKQLKPKLASKHSSDKYYLDITLFERMTRIGLKCCALTVQHRMTPEITSLTSFIYDKMTHHPNVTSSEKVRGMEKSLFFITHEIAENRINDVEMSFSNKHEGDMLLSLAKYLIQQGYSSSDVVVLVPFSAQQSYMANVAKKNPLLKGLEIFIIDSYSGQEKNIVLISLVRSRSGDIGFLSTQNTIAVALTRAKYGLYIIGNMKTIMQRKNVWSNVNKALKQKKSIGNSINLECQIHKTITTVSNSSDFEKVPNGGCSNICNMTLDCGHTCKLQCHPSLDRHKTYLCKAYCTRFCKAGLHKCQKKCHEKCGSCNVTTNITLDCGHNIQKLCGVDFRDVICEQPTTVTYFCCLQTVVPCAEANSLRYSRL